MRDGIDGEIYIVQARPETVKSREGRVIERYRITDARTPSIRVEGRSIGQRIGAGRARVIASIAEMDRVKAGDVLVTDMTDPDWEPIMKRAAAIVTNRGGRTCHAAIIARELGIPAVVGCNDATDRIAENEEITVSCAEGKRSPFPVPKEIQATFMPMCSSSWSAGSIWRVCRQRRWS